MLKKTCSSLWISFLGPTFKKNCGPRSGATQAASMESVSLRRLVDVARVPPQAPGAIGNSGKNSSHSQKFACPTLGLPDHLEFFQGHFIFQETRWTTFIGVRRGDETGFYPPLEIETKNQKIVRKSEVSISIPINRFNSCNDTLFTGMAITLHKSQLHYSGVVQWWAYSSLMSTPSPADSLCETCERIVLLFLLVA